MKNFTYLFVAALLFTACNSVTDNSLSTADQVLDDQFFNEALSQGSTDSCKKILDESLQGECIEVIAALKLTSQAQNSLNADICDKITLERYSDECKASVQEKIDRARTAEISIEMQAKDKELAQQALENQDTSFCQEINDDNAKYTCLYNILVNQALGADDPSICEQIGDVIFEQMCKDKFNVKLPEGLTTP